MVSPRSERKKEEAKRRAGRGARGARLAGGAGRGAQGAGRGAHGEKRQREDSGQDSSFQEPKTKKKIGGGRDVAPVESVKAVVGGRFESLLNAPTFDATTTYAAVTQAPPKERCVVRGHGKEKDVTGSGLSKVRGCQGGAQSATTDTARDVNVSSSYSQQAAAAAAGRRRRRWRRVPSNAATTTTVAVSAMTPTGAERSISVDVRNEPPRFDAREDEDEGEEVEDDGEEDEDEGDEVSRAGRPLCSFIVPGKSLSDTVGDKACCKNAKSLAWVFDGTGVEKDSLIAELSKLWLEGTSEDDGKVEIRTAAASALLENFLSLPIWREEMNLGSNAKVELRGEWATQQPDGDVALLVPAAATRTNMPNIARLAALALHGGVEDKTVDAVLAEWSRSHDTPDRRHLPKINYIWEVRVGKKTFRYVGETTDMVARMRNHLYGVSKNNVDDAKQDGHKLVVRALREEGGLRELGVSQEAAPRDVAAALIKRGAVKVYTSAILCEADLSTCAKMFKEVTTTFFGEDARTIPTLGQMIRFLASVGMVREAVETAWLRSRMEYEGSGAEHVGCNRSHPGLYYDSIPEDHYADQNKLVITFSDQSFRLGVQRVRVEAGVTRVIMGGLVTRHVLSNLVRCASAALERENALTDTIDSIFSSTSRWANFSLYVSGEHLVVKTASMGAAKTFSRLVENLPYGWTVNFEGKEWTTMTPIKTATRVQAANKERLCTLSVTLSDSSTYVFIAPEDVKSGKVVFQSEAGNNSVQYTLDTFFRNDLVKKWWSETKQVAWKIKSKKGTTKNDCTFDNLLEIKRFTYYLSPDHAVRAFSFMWAMHIMRHVGLVKSYTFRKSDGEELELRSPDETCSEYDEAKRLLENQAQQDANKRVLRFSLHGTNGDATVDVEAHFSQGKKNFSLREKTWTRW